MEDNDRPLASRSYYGQPKYGPAASWPMPGIKEATSASAAVSISPIAMEFPVSAPSGVCAFNASAVWCGAMPWATSLPTASGTNAAATSPII